MPASASSAAKLSKFILSKTVNLINVNIYTFFKLV